MPEHLATDSLGCSKVVRLQSCAVEKVGGQFSLSFRFSLPMGDCCIYLPLNNTMSSLSTAVPIDVENRCKHVVKERSILSLLTVQFVLGAFALSRLAYFEKPTGCQQPFQGRNMSGLRQNDNCFIAVLRWSAGWARSPGARRRYR